MRTVLIALLLAAAGLAGCIGGEDPAPELGSYTPMEAQAAGGGGHQHGGSGGLDHAAELDHFNASHTTTFEVDETPVAFNLTWELASGNATLTISDAAGATVLERVLTAPNGSLLEELDGEPGTWTMNVTGTDATGELAANAGDPAHYGLRQDGPITHEETYTVGTGSQGWSWTSAGTARIDFLIQGAAGSAAIRILDMMGEPIETVELTSSGFAEGTYTIQGAPGPWDVAIQTDGFTGTIEFSLAGA